MKKAVLALVIIVGSGSLLLSGCSGSSSSDGGKEYYCPMKCEGDKMYADEGTCPVCEMDLVTE